MPPKKKAKTEEAKKKEEAKKEEKKKEEEEETDSEEESDSEDEYEKWGCTSLLSFCVDMLQKILCVYCICFPCFDRRHFVVGYGELPSILIPFRSRDCLHSIWSLSVLASLLTHTPVLRLTPLQKSSL